MLRNGVVQALKSISCGYILVKQTGPEINQVQLRCQPLGKNRIAQH